MLNRCEQTVNSFARLFKSATVCYNRTRRRASALYDPLLDGVHGLGNIDALVLLVLALAQQRLEVLQRVVARAARQRKGRFFIGENAHGLHLDAAQVTAAADEVQAAADFMFANCKLEVEPDIALHGLLAVLIKGASELRAKPVDLSPLAVLVLHRFLLF